MSIIRSSQIIVLSIRVAIAGTVTPPSIIGNPWVVIEWLEAPNYWRELDDEPDSEKLPATMFETALEKTCFKRGLKTEDTLAIAPGSVISEKQGVNDKCMYLSIISIQCVRS